MRIIQVVNSVANIANQLYANRKPIFARNCADKTHSRGYCWVCHRDHLPLEKHHLAGRKHASFTVPVCLNCHALLSRRQFEWPDLWRGDQCIAFLIFGFLDYCILASDPTLPHELFNQRCEETMTKSIQKTKAMLSPLIKMMLFIIALGLLCEIFRASQTISGR